MNEFHYFCLLMYHSYQSYSVLDTPSCTQALLLFVCSFPALASKQGKEQRNNSSKKYCQHSFIFVNSSAFAIHRRMNRQDFAFDLGIIFFPFIWKNGMDSRIICRTEIVLIMSWFLQMLNLWFH